jgi:hypothetical protein
MQPFTMEHLFSGGGGGVIVRICVSMIELPLQTMIGWVSALGYMLLGVNELLWPCLIFIR